MLIALDMDGTLLNSNGQVSRRNKEAIVTAQKQGPYRGDRDGQGV